MKIERISENQIRCTLNKADLADRELLLNELAYGTDKAKALFRDMMQQASYELGFEAEDIPLMIEAIPVSPECLILVITKVEDPEELDTRFSKFSKPSDYSLSDDLSDEDEEEDDDEDDELLEGASNILDLLNEIDSELDNLDESSKLALNKTRALPGKSDLAAIGSGSDKEESSLDIYKIYLFPKLADVTAASVLLAPVYQGRNSLYKSPVDNMYHLVVYKSEHTPESYSKICNILSEYGQKEKCTYATMSYMHEHFQVILGEQAVQTLAKL